MNSVQLIGRITRDIELRVTNSNKSVVQFTLAVNRKYTEANGEKKADFISCTAWSHTADFMNTYVKKGNLLGIVGKLQTRNYEQDGRTVYVTEVVCDSVQFLESKNSDNKSPHDYQSQNDLHESSKSLNNDNYLPF